MRNGKLVEYVYNNKNSKYSCISFLLSYNIGENKDIISSALDAMLDIDTIYGEEKAKEFLDEWIIESRKGIFRKFDTYDDFIKYIHCKGLPKAMNILLDYLDAAYELGVDIGEKQGFEQALLEDRDGYEEFEPNDEEYYIMSS